MSNGIVTDRNKGYIAKLTNIKPYKSMYKCLSTLKGQTKMYKWIL